MVAAVKKVLRYGIEKEEDFEDELDDGSTVNLDGESDDDGLSLPEGDFTYVDAYGTQSLVDSDLLGSSSSRVVAQTHPSLEPAEIDSLLLLDPDLSDRDVESESGMYVRERERVCVSYV